MRKWSACFGFHRQCQAKDHFQPTSFCAEGHAAAQRVTSSPQTVTGEVPDDDSMIDPLGRTCSSSRSQHHSFRALGAGRNPPPEVNPRLL